MLSAQCVKHSTTSMTTVHQLVLTPLMNAACWTSARLRRHALWLEGIIVHEDVFELLAPPLQLRQVWMDREDDVFVSENRQVRLLCVEIRFFHVQDDVIH